MIITIKGHQFFVDEITQDFIYMRPVKDGRAYLPLFWQWVYRLLWRVR